VSKKNNICVTKKKHICVKSCVGVLIVVGFVHRFSQYASDLSTFYLFSLHGYVNTYKYLNVCVLGHIVVHVGTTDPKFRLLPGLDLVRIFALFH
jgi:hypothetical protein